MRPVTALLPKAAVAAALALVLARAFMGPPPRRLHPLLTLIAGFVGLIGYPIAVLVAADRHPQLASILLGGAVASMAVAFWAARGPSDDEGDDDDEGPEPPVDWEAFDRERERWDWSATR
ncbi:hypothetical protein DSM104329_02081 [Capillimicrobium parvum]|uniref:Uncharacterized protein n=1 Tax=Capillimicrobium parvum TaxID=2884022 RepID=A0A9E7BZU5_9ACTN|nr:hypothetical protein DSM104329_02081 [Capillimicrobium parvum]